MNSKGLLIFLVSSGIVYFLFAIMKISQCVSVELMQSFVTSLAVGMLALGGIVYAQWQFNIRQEKQFAMDHQQKLDDELRRHLYTLYKALGELEIVISDQCDIGLSNPNVTAKVANKVDAARRVLETQLLECESIITILCFDERALGLHNYIDELRTMASSYVNLYARSSNNNSFYAFVGSAYTTMLFRWQSTCYATLTDIRLSIVSTGRNINEFKR
ncbi:hypothetical protein DS2_10362 [Catenovulum agarivorans DS-2]|uniref:Uncharacterized protein n=1 Tax=Catenovulum agarivorans DS-2 TaxID=1328313 RepID=W7QD54_9ALTE|nr:hypothetical protein [Catenovulum agarivorans]EWH09846.1 hypothetical protein DS2_10362 [Catenovulum agarivorans DS-2]